MPTAAFILFVVAGVSDGVDGFIAKRFDMRSEFGAYIDPLADKALLVSIYVTLAIVTATGSTRALPRCSEPPLSAASRRGAEASLSRRLAGVDGGESRCWSPARQSRSR